jgi:hypothetical protein
VELIRLTRARLARYLLATDSCFFQLCLCYSILCIPVVAVGGGRSVPCFHFHFITNYLLMSQSQYLCIFLYLYPPYCLSDSLSVSPSYLISSQLYLDQHQRRRRRRWPRLRLLPTRELLPEPPPLREEQKLNSTPGYSWTH